MSFSRIVRIAATGSTNSDVMAALSTHPAQWPHLAVLVAQEQRAGRGRSGNTWSTPAGQALTCTVVLRPDDAAAPHPLTWLPLLTGLAVRRALAPWVTAGLKWPNDVVGQGVNPAPGWGWGSKLAGILSELHPSGAVVVGVGINCLQRAEDLPVAWAGSIAGELAAGRGTPGPHPEPTPERVLAGLGTALAELWQWEPDQVRDAYETACVTVGHQVRALVPGGAEVTGRAVAIAPDGALEIHTDAGSRLIAAGEVRSVRPQPGT